MKFDVEKLKFDAAGLIPAIVQDIHSREVLMLAYMNRESLQKTLDSGHTWFWSRSRNELWHKGATSGNTQEVVELSSDCDGDTIRVLVKPNGPACHNGTISCFTSELNTKLPTGEDNIGELLVQLYEIIKRRQQDRPEGSYTTYLFDQGLDKILKKVGEEAAETIIAAKNDDREALVSETSDLLYHLIVMMVERGITLDKVSSELNRRKSTTAPGSR